MFDSLADADLIDAMSHPYEQVAAEISAALMISAVKAGDMINDARALPTTAPTPTMAHRQQRSPPF